MVDLIVIGGGPAGYRALDGAPAAKFLKALCVNLENFGLLLAK